MSGDWQDVIIHKGDKYFLWEVEREPGHERNKTVTFYAVVTEGKEKGLVSMLYAK